MSNRIQWVDYTKAINIFLVVLGHTAIPLQYRSYIYAFHIPLFFFLSGYFFNYTKYPVFSSFIKKRTIQIVVPYFAINFITYIVWLLIGQYTGEDAMLDISPIKPFIGIFYGSTSGNSLHHNVPMWFLACLYMTEFIFYPLFRSKNKCIHFLTIILLLCIGIIEKNFINTTLPWGLNIVPTTLVLYGCGYLFKQYIHFQINIKKAILLIIPSSILVIIIASINGKIEVSDAYYGNYFLFWMGAFSGIFLIFSIGKLLEITHLNIKLMLFIGQNTLLIFGFHLLAGGIIKGVTFYLLKLPLDIYQLTWVNIVYSIISILILLPFVFFVNKYIPWIGGKFKN